MDHFGGLDVSVKETSISIVDDTGRIVRELKTPTLAKLVRKALA
jgi:transposase